MPAIPRMVRCDCSVCNFIRAVVSESREMPPLPVSRMKFRLVREVADFRLKYDDATGK